MDRKVRFREAEETPQEQVDRVGFELDEFKPKHSPDDPVEKIVVILFTVFTLAYPIIHVRLKFPWEFWYGAVTVVIANAFIALILLIRLWSIREEWTGAKSEIGSANGYTACKAVQKAFQTFRRLMKWNLLFRYTGHWTTVVYVLLFLLSAMHLKRLGVSGLIADSHLTYLFGDLGTGLLGYYAFLFVFPRMAIQLILGNFTRRVDPTYQICSALGEIHHRYRLATLPRR